MKIFKQLGLSQQPLVVAPLAGVSDIPFRLMCQRGGAELTYVEMLSAVALLYNNKKTYELLRRHPEERCVGVQVTGRDPEEVAKAVAILDPYPFETIDLNMGCPAKKVVRSGSGSAILKDIERVRRTVALARAATDKPLSCKIRLGWDHESLNYLTVSEIIANEGADFMTVHGRTKSDTYQNPVNLRAIQQIKDHVTIPVLGNGNLFTPQDLQRMSSLAQVDGLMVSRGALGNPWVFARPSHPVTVDAWLQTVLDHMDLQEAIYGQAMKGLVCMRKHLLWYLSEWPQAKSLRKEIVLLPDFASIRDTIKSFANALKSRGISTRPHVQDRTAQMLWDPKFEMDRQLDRGVGDIDPIEGALALT